MIDFGTSYENDSFDSTFRAYALKYFEIHASQRLQAFRFYIILAIAVGGALMHYWDQRDWRPVALGLLLALLSVVFAALDKRTRDLIENAEQALKFLDSDLANNEQGPHELALFARDQHTKEDHLLGFISYKTCFAAVFAMGFVGGLIPSVMLLCQ